VDRLCQQAQRGVARSDEAGSLQRS
jgi:hypothetical protein